ncbi:hypothetical protein [Limosilactobacillus fastidiosus]|uniref:Uncharacterized protein n=1 Tax=Limosilactobacillus fastidiosus TaxID=2759855 RepID=A0A7W3TY48_9LACO|nr:hypothetical protein [Limosilactobacillus fastidiosus]MBB1063151.1 hypothetical protein [Limosilactobacillus fastidiosus]MBB1085433.1 hypothetical protein [Limosilactobacillus fastidiosus]MCD7083734.1 hypothetical protein [Limosilactobacillus fastidiosus]MCD7085415.1 hypothetical protein [Limosilactobacillus fastidiosus]MCD7114820.1 hypothetical protein [Limosilactobacillus fastidiosus]
MYSNELDFNKNYLNKERKEIFNAVMNFDDNTKTKFLFFTKSSLRDFLSDLQKKSYLDNNIGFIVPWSDIAKRIYINQENLNYYIKELSDWDHSVIRFLLKTLVNALNQKYSNMHFEVSDDEKYIYLNFS